MLEEPSLNKISRRTRKARTKRRERYKLLNSGDIGRINNQYDDFEYDTDTSSTESVLYQNNNSVESCHRKTLPARMGNKNLFTVCATAIGILSECDNQSTDNMQNKEIEDKIRSKEEIKSPEKRDKKVVVPLKPVKLKRASILIKKLKLKTKPSSTQSVDLGDIGNVPLPSTTSTTGSDSPVERQTPEGDDNKLILTRSQSENHLKEQWKNIEAGDKESSSSSKSVVDFDNLTLTERKISLPDRTKSLENFKNMPAYGELILDTAALASNANQSTSKPKDHLYKLLVIGDLGAGKTSIIKRYVHRFFTQHYRATIGVDFALKVLNWDDNTLIRLQLWDIAGQERYGNMTRVYYKEAVGAFIVFDVTRRNTFESVSNWKSDLDSKVQLPNGSPIPCVLLANKCDQQKEGLVTNPAKMDEYCKENGFTAWFETSARDNINIDEAAKALVEKILEYDSVINGDASKGDQFTLSKPETQPNGRKTCSC